MTTYDFQEDNKLVAAYQQGDEVAFNTLFKKHERLIKLVAYKFRRHEYLDADQRYSSCMLGFLSAARGFDINGKVQFNTYAHHCMRSKVLDDVAKHERKGRKELELATGSLFHKTSAKYNEVELIHIVKGEDFVAFQDSFPNIQPAIDFAKSKLKPFMHPYIMDLVYGEYTHVEMAQHLGVTRQVVEYHVRTFKNNIKNYLLEMESAA